MLPVTGKLISCFKQIFGWPVTLLDDSMSAWTELSVQLSTILKKEKKEIKSTLAYLLNSSSYTLTCVCQCFNGLLMNPQNIFIRYVISFSFTHLPIENLLFKLQGINCLDYKILFDVCIVQIYKWAHSDVVLTRNFDLFINSFELCILLLTQWRNWIFDESLSFCGLFNVPQNKDIRIFQMKMLLIKIYTHSTYDLNTCLKGIIFQWGDLYQLLL